MNILAELRTPPSVALSTARLVCRQCDHRAVPRHAGVGISRKLFPTWHQRRAARRVVLCGMGASYESDGCECANWCHTAVR